MSLCDDCNHVPCGCPRRAELQRFVDGRYETIATFRTITEAMDAMWAGKGDRVAVIAGGAVEHWVVGARGR